MAADIGPKIGIDGEAEYRKQLNNIIQQAKTLGSEMKAVTSAFGKNEDSQESLTAQSEVLSKQIQVQKQRVEQLEKGLSESAKKYGETATQTLKWKQAVNEAKAGLNGMESTLGGIKSKLDNFETAADDAADSVDEIAKSAENMAASMKKGEKSAFGFGDALKANLAASTIIDGIKTIAGAISDIVSETKEYRKIMGSLEVSSANAGYSAEETEKSYRELYGVLADDQTAATTTANLQALGLAQKDLQRLISGTIGAWATYGDSIPIDGLAESINETVKVGKVTGTFADVLNWAGTSEDAFNEKLEKSKNAAQRANIVLRELASQGLISAGEGWQQNNKSLVESNQAMADFQDKTAQMAERIEPITSAVQNGLNQILSKLLELTESVDFSALAQSISKGFDRFVTEIVPEVLNFGNFLIDNKDSIIAAVAGIGAGFAAWKVASMINGVVQSIMAFKKANEAATIAQWAMNAAQMANPILLVVTLIGALIGAIIALWNTNEDFRNGVMATWDAIKEGCEKVWGAIVDFFTKTIPDAWNSVVNFFKGIPKWWNDLWSKIGQFFINLWNSLIAFLQSIPQRVGYAIGQIIGFVIQLPGRLWNIFQQTVAKVVQFGKNVFTAAKEWITKTISDIITWFSELPGKVWEWLKNTTDKVVSWGSGMVSKAKEAAGNLVNNVMETVKSLPGKMLQIGEDIVTGIWDGITGMFSWIKEKISGFFGGIVDGIKDSLGIHSPSKVFAEIGKYSGQGFGAGLSNSMDAALKNAKVEMQAGVNGLNAAVSVSGRRENSGNASQNYNYGGFAVNVYAAQGQSEEVIANRAAEIIQEKVFRKKAVYGV